MKKQSSLPASVRRRLEQLHGALLALHKGLLDAERVAYEKEHGHATAAKILDLAINDPQFAWLRQISELIVRIDETMESEEGSSGAENLIAYARSLLVPQEDGGDFQRKYDAALQRQPDLVLLHRTVMEILAHSA